MFKKIVALLSILLFSLQQYQQFNIAFSDDNLGGVFGETGKYHPSNTMGGIYGSQSFLISNKSEIILFYGHRSSEFQGDYHSDQTWKYSTELNQWAFIKGRKNPQEDGFSTVVNMIDNNGTLERELHTFNVSNQISGKKYSKGCIDTDGKIITFFGGHFRYDLYNSKLTNELWRYNIVSNSYAVDFFPENADYFFANYTVIGEYHEKNIPSGRYYHEMVRINEDEIFLIGGNGYFHQESTFKYTNPLSDWWILSETLNQWKYLGGDIYDIHAEFIRGETNIYHSNNNIGAKQGVNAFLVNNKEEIMIFGGWGNIDCNRHNFDYLSALQFYNITSNMFKWVSGFRCDSENESNYANGLSREYNDENLPGGRNRNGMWQINDEEFGIFGGKGYSIFTDGYLNDEWVYNIKKNQWKFTGKETTGIIVNSFTKISGETYSDSTISGGIKSVNSHYIAEKQELYILNGFGYYTNSKGYINSVWRVYYGNMCNLLEDIDQKVCNQRGKCYEHNFCQCQEEFGKELSTEVIGYFGNDCEITKCFGVFSNDTDNVCSQNGMCVNGQCLCFNQSPYTNADCSIDQILKTFIDNIWIFITVPVSIVTVIFLFLLICSGLIYICLKYRKISKKMDGIDDIDLVLEEAKIEQNSSKNGNPKIEINKSLFEIQYRDIELLQLIGDGGSLSQIFLCKWKNNYCAYKSFRGTILSSKNSFEEFEKEVKIFSSIHHPNILQFYGAVVNPPKIGILLQYCSKGDLANFISKYNLNHKNSSYSIQNKVRILKEIASGMSYLHSLNIIHRDLKPENVLIDDHEISKIMDFGMSKLNGEDQEKTMTKRIGTSFYMSPEVYTGKHYSNKCDVYAFAILIFVTITENFFPYGIQKNQNSEIVVVLGEEIKKLEDNNTKEKNNKNEKRRMDLEKRTKKELIEIILKNEGNQNN